MVCWCGQLALDAGSHCWSWLPPSRPATGSHSCCLSRRTTEESSFRMQTRKKAPKLHSGQFPFSSTRVQVGAAFARAQRSKQAQSTCLLSVVEVPSGMDGPVGPAGRSSCWSVCSACWAQAGTSTLPGMAKTTDNRHAKIQQRKQSATQGDAGGMQAGHAI